MARWAPCRSRTSPSTPGALAFTRRNHGARHRALARHLGPRFNSGTPFDTIVVTFLTLFLPAAFLSGVHPTIVKVQLRDLHATGRVVGRLSAIGTAGAIVGTYATGFILVGHYAISVLLIWAGAIIVSLGILVTLVMEVSGRRIATTLALALVFSATCATLTLDSKSPCLRESSYYCISVLGNTANPNGRYVKLDKVIHGYVDLKNKKHLEFDYTKAIGGVLDHARPTGTKMSMLSVGGGAFAIPNYVEATRPNSQIEVVEIDPAIVDTAREDLGLEESDHYKVKVGDARAQLSTIPDNTYDVVVGDAFGGESVPWQLTTKEFNDDIARVLDADGTYVMNIIDYAPLKFARAEARTLRKTFPAVAVVSVNSFLTRSYKGVKGGNVEIIAGKSTDLNERIASSLPAGSYSVITGKALDDFIGDVPVLTDDYAPVDQLKSLFTE
jgi:hypothetical protein